MDDQAGDGRRLLVGQVPVHHAVEIADRHRAIDHAPSRRLAARTPCTTRSCSSRNVADDLLQNILERDEAHDHAIFVDDEGEMRLALEKRLQLILERASPRARTRASA